MKRQIILCLTVVLLSVAGAVAQTGSKQPGPAAGSATVTDIRKVDFSNFTYSSSQCSQEYGKMGIGKLVRVRSGEFKTRNAYFSVTSDKIIYADLTGDGREEAIIPVDCGASGANFSNSEIFLYSIQDGHAALLAGLGDKVMERDYRRSYTDADSYWGVNENGVKAKNGLLQMEVLADGSHAAPAYIVTLEYRLNGNTLGLNGKPQRRKFEQ